MPAPPLPPGWVPSLTALQAAGWPDYVVELAMRAGLSQIQLLALAAEEGPHVVKVVEKVLRMLLPIHDESIQEKASCQ